MNKVYRVIWNVVKTACLGGRASLTIALLATLGFTTGRAFGLPTGPQVVNGSAGITTVGGVMTVTNSPNAIINWQGFSIAANEATRFLQQNAGSAVLNRVVGGDASRIYGLLQSNGKVFLINQNGILFGPGARVDVNGLVASTLNITNQDFLAGRMTFNAGATAGPVANQGSITTPSGGSVYLIAPDVTNSGIITAPNGDILLAAGKEVLLVDRDSPEIAVVVSAPASQALNLGTLAAEAGRIGIYGGIVRQAGIISADSAVSEGGRIYLKASQKLETAAGSITSADGVKGGTISAKVEENGTIKGELLGRGDLSAQGDGSTGSGGFIETSAAKVDLNGLRVNTKGGTWLIDPTNIYIAVDQTTATSAGMSGTDSSVDTSAPPNFQAAGSPTDSLLLTSTLQSALASNSVQVSSYSTGTGSGTINVVSPVSWSSANSLTLLASGGDIRIGAGVSVTGGSGGMNLVAGWNNTGFATTTGIGNLTFGAGSSLSTTGNLLFSVGNSISQPAGSVITANALTIIGSQGGIRLPGGASLLGTNMVTTLAADISGAGAGALTFINGKALAIDTAGGFNGINALNNTSQVSITASSLAITQPIVSAGNVVLTLAAGGGGSDSASGGITAQGLELLGNGSFALTNGGYAVQNLAGNLSGLGSVSLNNSGSLNIGTVNSTGLYGAGTLSLKTTGPLTQSPGALLGSTSLNVEGSSVTLTEANPVGIISGKATAGDFRYKSVNGIAVDAVAGTAGITASGLVVLDGGNGIGQNAPITATGLKLVSSGPVGLTNAANAFGSVAASVSGSLSLLDSSALTVGTVDGLAGITATNGDVGLQAPSLTVSSLSATPTIVSGNNIQIATGPFTMSGTGVYQTKLNAANGVALLVDGLTMDTAAAIFGANGIVVSPRNTVTPSITLKDGSSCVTAGCLALNTAYFSQFSTTGGPLLIGDPALSIPIDLQAALAWSSGGLGIGTASTVTEATGSGINTLKLAVLAGDAVTMNGPNTVTNLAVQSSVGPISFNVSSGPVIVDTIAGIEPVTGKSYSAAGLVSPSGGITLSNSSVAAGGNITLNAPVSAGSGTVSLNATSGAISGSGPISGNQLTITASGAVGPLVTKVNSLSATSSTGAVSITNASPLTITGASAGSDLLVTSAGMLTSAGLISASGNVSLTAAGTTSDFSLQEMGQVQGSTVTLVAGQDILVTGGSVHSSSPTGVTSVIAGRDVKVSGGTSYSGSIAAVGDVSITASTGKLYLTSNGSTSAASVTAQSLYTVYLNVPGQTSGGYVIDGVAGGATISTVNTATGIFVATSPAVPGSTLQVTYAAPPPPPPPPTIDQCIADPSLSGCSVVLPSLSSCISAPSTPGCSVVLPTLATCTATPTASGCSVVLPSLSSCISAPSIPGCSVVLPTLAACTATPTAPGCSVVLPPVVTCATDPTLPGCSTVLPPQQQQQVVGGSGAVLTAVNSVSMTPVAPVGLQLLGLAPMQRAGTPPEGGTGSSGNGGDEKDKKKGADTNNQGGTPPAGDNSHANAPKNYCN